MNHIYKFQKHNFITQSYSDWLVHLASIGQKITTTDKKMSLNIRSWCDPHIHIEITLTFLTNFNISQEWYKIHLLYLIMPTNHDILNWSSYNKETLGFEIWFKGYCSLLLVTLTVIKVLKMHTSMNLFLFQTLNKVFGEEKTKFYSIWLSKNCLFICFETVLQWKIIFYSWENLYFTSGAQSVYSNRFLAPEVVFRFEVCFMKI